MSYFRFQPHPQVDDPERLYEPYRNEEWLKLYPLNKDTVLQYFSWSYFYQRGCYNDVVTWMDKDVVDENMVEYVVNEKESSDNFFVIERRLRDLKRTTLSKYYCIDEVIYQVPDLKSLIDSRVTIAAVKLKNASENLQQAQLALRRKELNSVVNADEFKQLSEIIDNITSE